MIDTGFLETIETYDQELDQYEHEIETLRDQWQDTYEQKQDLVHDALEQLQEELDDGETIPLVQSEEFGRGGHFEYEEHLTSDGLIATNVEAAKDGWDDRDYGPETLYLWPDDQPLDIEDEYLQTRARNTPAFYDKLVTRLEAIEAGDDTLPALSTSYD